MRRIMAAFLILAAAPALAAEGVVGTAHHDASVRLDPAARSLFATDRVTFQAPVREARFLLHEGLAPRAEEAGASLVPGERRAGDPAWAEAWRLSLPVPAASVTLSYGGEIFHPLESVGKEYARGFRSTPGIISEEGTVLSRGSLWLPDFGGDLFTFRVEAALPPGWDAVSQGGREAREVFPAAESRQSRVAWDSARPEDDAYLVAAPFTLYESAENGRTAMAYLREPDPALAKKYLDATHQYLALYEKLVGPYPFPKFALVENFWETGFGMPSFTLLGPKVVRFPFLLRTSYPHEILHNWWGNSVYVDYGSGNWAEGLTAYLADHLMAEEAGTGHEHREATLQKYRDYVAENADGPLTSFVSRHSSASEALGYGKSLMLFHMLRRELGDETFRKGLARFYADNVWKRASWADVRAAFEAVPGRPLAPFFAQWVERTGAPALKLVDVRAEPAGSGWTVSGTIEQTQAGEAYALKVPLGITTAGGGEMWMETVRMEGRLAPFSFVLPDKPQRLDVDPAFDLFRLLDPAETPPALSGIFGAKEALFVLPSEAPAETAEAYRALAETWKSSGETALTIVRDEEIGEIPADRAVWVAGWENRFLGRVKEAFAGYPVAFREAEADVGSATVSRAGQSLVLTARNPADPAFPIAFLAADPPAAAAGLARKLPHYHKYSYVGFEGEAPMNTAKGRWSALGSPLTFVFVPGAERGALPYRAPLAALPPLFSREQMMETVRRLSDPALEGRGFGSTGLETAAAYVAAEMENSGLSPGGDGKGWFQAFPTEGGEPRCAATLKNVVGLVRGTKPEFDGQAVVVAAHYDALGRGWPDCRKGNEGLVHPGADDNASGVAVLLELARHFAAAPPERTVVFAAFAGEEGVRSGSRFFVENGPWPAEKIWGMVNLDTVGRLGSGKLLVLGAGSAREWVPIFMGAGFVTGAKVEAVTKESGGSDQVSFLDAGVPAVQLFTGPHAEYHDPGDTPEKIDSAGLAAVAAVAKEAVAYLAGREEPLTRTASGASGSPHTAGGAEPAQETTRKAGLGTVPDFSWQGKGVKIGAVNPGSPAEQAGLKAGDLITGVGGEEVGDLASYSAALKKRSPGERVRVSFIRDGAPLEAEVTLEER